MKNPELVAQITSEMRKQVSIPVTVKCRLGVDDLDKYEDVLNFIKVVSVQGGITKFIIHARKCLLHGLNTKDNRNIPILKYDWVLQLKKDFPHLKFIINGGFTQLNAIKEILGEENGLEGCMVGRMAFNSPWDLSVIDRELFGVQKDSLTRRQILH
mmetsp:Transcript_26258/g.25427  ORF Transcript_26258/g.25427 Transcript_26258/m.25427 type:complete len:156 (+) Transcript_26258:357-824(+)